MEIHILFIILISAGLAFGIYGVVIQQGANLVRMDVRTLAMGLAWGAIQLCASLIGYGTGRWILNFEMGREHSSFWANLLAGLILAGIGVRMLMKALQKKTFLEHRMEKLDIREDVVLSMRLCAHGFFAGIAAGLLQFNLPLVLACAFVISSISAAGGYISGRVWGVELCGKAYAICGGLFCLVSIALQLM